MKINSRLFYVHYFGHVGNISVEVFLLANINIFIFIYFFFLTSCLLCCPTGAEFSERIVFGQSEMVV